MPQAGGDVVISGISGKFPEADDLAQLRYNLENKIDMITEDNRRWDLEAVHPEVPRRSGKVNHVTKFDGGFFGIHRRQVDTMDATCRMLLERAVEAVLDAGVNPKELEGSKTGVFIGTCYQAIDAGRMARNCFAMTGILRTMYAHRISYWMKLQGPSYTVDTGCSSSLYALEQAYKAIKSGECEAAIVAAAQLNLHPALTLQFKRLGVLSSVGRCKSFDNDADGYVRSEAVVAVFLQKAKHAKRVIATVVHAKTNCDGFKPEAITFPSSVMQRTLLEEFYKECGVDPSVVSYLEGHGPGTRVGDPQELRVADEFFCKERKVFPLFLGSIKSNLGHTEPAAGLCSLVKILISMEAGCIMPNLNFNKPREGIAALQDGRCVVVTEATPWPNEQGLAGINSFGLGGANAHILLQWNKKHKQNRNVINDNIPRLICVSGRTEEAVNVILQDVKSRNLDVEYVRLLQDIFSTEVPGHVYRGYSIISKTGMLATHLKRCNETNRPLYVLFSASETALKPLAASLFELSTFVKTFQRIHKILEPKGVNFLQIAKTKSTSTFDNILLTGAFQMAIIDTFTTINLSPVRYIGCSLGEIVCAYANNTIDFEQTTILLLYFAWHLQSSKDNQLNGKSTASLKPFEHFNSTSKSILAHIKDSLFDLSKELLPRNSVVLQIGEGVRNLDVHTILFPIEEATTATLLATLGELYEEGYSFKIDRLYPKIEFPVSRGTPMISPLIKWNHSEDWFTAFYRVQTDTKGGCREVNISTKVLEWSFLKRHAIDGRTVFPATGYVYLVWETFAMMRGVIYYDLNVVLEDVKLLQATSVSGERNNLLVMIQRSSGRFEVTDSENEIAVVTGKIYLADDTVDKVLDLPVHRIEDETPLEEQDIYKEFHLRGYDYTGLFRGIKKCSLNAKSALVEWNDNWVAFLDNVMQMQILNIDSRNLHVPTVIKRISIHAKQHRRYLEKVGQNRLVPVHVHKEAGLLKSGGIQISGLNTIPLVRHKTTAEPVVEKYVFVPNEATLSLQESTRVIVQIVLENDYNVHFKCLELINESAPQDSLLPQISEALAELMLIQPELSAQSEKENLTSDICASLAIGANLLKRGKFLQKVLSALKPNGFILSCEGADFTGQNVDNSKIVAVHTISSTKKLVLFRKSLQSSRSEEVVCVSDDYTKFEWVKELQTLLQRSGDVLLYSQYETSGMLGLMKCLRMEAVGGNVRCVFIRDEAPAFDPQDPFYSKQLCKGLVFNIFQNGQWGTYRHLRLQKEVIREVEHCFARTTVNGDLSSVKWLEGHLTTKSLNQNLIQVHYASLNFKDVMIASGRISSESSYLLNRTEQSSMQGLEFSGCDEAGSRVMGIVQSGAFSSLLVVDPYLKIPVPDGWSLEDAATVPAVYTTVYYAFFIRTQLKRGQSVLIHAGSGGVGQAAINVALSLDCEVYTTVGTKAKRDFLRKAFPKLKDDHIGSSRNTTFVQMVMRGTKGRGVDVVLNSLAEEKLQASLRCLKRGGTFLEIGRADVVVDKELALGDFNFHCLVLEMTLRLNKYKKRLVELVSQGIQEGVVKPLRRTVFERNEIQKAFNYMAGGKHIGKVVIKVRNGDKLTFNGAGMYHCDPEGSYIIIGGLGGFGLELADWLVLRGARKIVLTSRNGIKNGYQAFRIRTWRSYGVIVEVAKDDVKTDTGCKAILSKAANLGPIQAIFNLAVVLQDAFFPNQTAETFSNTFTPKAIAVHNFDKITRELYPQLRDFVVFSSFSCGVGVGGQTNYGMANSVSERICEKRRRDGYSGLAIQWGPIGDVGIVAGSKFFEKELRTRGALQQTISSCIELMDVFLRQSEVVVSSMVIAEKKTTCTVNNIVDRVASIIGIRNLKTISFQSTLPELGLDSRTTTEVRQTFESEFKIFLTIPGVRSLTFARLQEMQDEIDKTNKGDTNTQWARNDYKEKNLQLLLNVTEEELPEKPLVQLSNSDKKAPKIFLLPGIEGNHKNFNALIKDIPAHQVFCLQYISQNVGNTIKGMASNCFRVIQQFATPSEELLLVAHSFGCLVLLELLALVENNAFKAKAILIDGAPEYLVRAAELPLNVLSHEFELSTLTAFMRVWLTEDELETQKEFLKKCGSFAEKIDLSVNVCMKENGLSEKFQRSFLMAFHRKLKALCIYKPGFGAINTPVVLFRPQQVALEDIAEDYNLSKFTRNQVEVRFFKGDHFTILRNPELSQNIVQIFD